MTNVIDEILRWRREAAAVAASIEHNLDDATLDPRERADLHRFRVVILDALRTTEPSIEPRAHLARLGLTND